MAKVRIDFSKYTNEDLLVFADNVVNKVTISNKFPNIYPDIVTGIKARDTFRDAVIKAQNAGRMEIADRNQKRKNLEKVLKLWGSHIEDITNGDKIAILDAGYVPHRDYSMGALPTIPTNVRLLDGLLKGSVKVRCKKVDNAITYELRYYKDTETEWTGLPISYKTTTEIANIAEPGTIIWLQMRASNNHGYSDWSNPATIMVR